MMKIFITVLLATLFHTYGFSQSATFDRTTHDFGKISSTETRSTNFTLTNTGTKPLVILGIDVNCKCTSTKWDKSPVMAGQKRTITVNFDPKEKGVFYKKLRVKTSDGQYDIYVKGTVE